MTDAGKAVRLSARLYAAVSLITPESVVADVGCDHAYASIYIVKNNMASRVIALDVNPGPLRIAEENVKKYGVENQVKLRLSDGLAALRPEDRVSTLLICGMGGRLAIDILESNDAVTRGVAELVLQPQSDICLVRHYLHGAGFMIVKEKMVAEGGKHYNIIKAERGVQSFENEYEYVYGKYLIDSRDKVFLSYLKKLYAVNEGIIRGLMKDGAHGERRKKLERDNAEIFMILKGGLPAKGGFDENR